ncbi:unnamed protein product [Sphagnum compactum]
MNAGVLSCKPIGAAREEPWLHVRRELFEYGILPYPSLMHNDVVSGLRNLRDRLLLFQQASPISTWSLNNNSSSSSIKNGESDAVLNVEEPHTGRQKRVATAAIAASLELSEAHAHLVLDTLASILPDEGEEGVDRLARTPLKEIDSVGADVDDVLLYLYVQSYRRVPSRPHRDAAAVADVWPSTSAIDRLLPSPSPLQARSASFAKRLMPCQAEEEVNQLAYVQKHLPSLLALLAESTEDGENGTKVITAGKFERLGLLLRAKDANTESIPLIQAAPFFANSDPAMPAAPVPLEQVLEWISLHICAASENLHQKPLVEKNGSSDPVATVASDVMMMDAATNTVGSTTGAQTIFLPNGLLQLSNDWRPEGLTFVDGVVRASVLKQEQDIKGGSVKVSHCHDSAVYVLAPLKYVSVVGCSDSIVVLGAVGKTVRVEHCERVQLIVPTARITIANCRECLFYLGVNQLPLFTGDNHNLQVAPYNTFYPRLEVHLAQVGVDATVNRWDHILTLGLLDHNDTFIHTNGVANVQVEGATLLQPEKFTIFTVPKWNENELGHELLTRANPFLLPKPYLLAQQHRSKAAENLKQMLYNAALEDNKKRHFTSAIHAHFREWLFASGNICQIYDLQGQD